MNKLSLKQKFLLIMFGLLIAFIGAEILFRIGGFIANKTILQTSNIADKANTTILCVGDSSTYGLGASNTDKINFPAASGRGINPFFACNRGKPRGMLPQEIQLSGSTSVFTR